VFSEKPIESLPYWMRWRIIVLTQTGGGTFMEVARVTSKGQVTIPVGIRKRMNLKDGDKVAFLERDGKCYIENAALVAINRAQEAFAGEAERLGLKNEEDVVAMVKEIRRARWEKRNADHA
jgi:AbrB family looped-hinge helix DNA binding protein